jgi:NAD-dependent deacetylase
MPPACPTASPGRERVVISAAERAAAVLREARRPLAFTGAGISVASGIPDFRSPGGLWAIFDPTEYATLSAFVSDPEKAWVFYRALARALHGKVPNAAHESLATLERHGRLDGIITQNIDRLHQDAGSSQVLELHGSHDTLCCLSCTGRQLFSEDLAGDEAPIPFCARCGVPLKPDVVLFEEPVRHMAEAAAWLAHCDLLLVIGTSAQVAPAASLPGMVRAAGGSLLEFNLEPTDLTRAGLGEKGILVRGPAAETLCQVLTHLGL